MSKDSPAPPITLLKSTAILLCNTLLKSSMSLTDSLLNVDISVLIKLVNTDVVVLISVDVSLERSLISTLMLWKVSDERSDISADVSLDSSLISRDNSLDV